MELIELPEPELEFANGAQHLCPRHGIAEHSVYDAFLSIRSEKILVGVISTDDGIKQFDKFIK